jgi:hypothetical protein
MTDLRKIHGAANCCARCGAQFGSLKSFDKHQDVDYDRSPTAVRCTAPEALGLVRDDHGVWQTVAGAASRSRLAQMGHRERHTVPVSAAQPG